MITTTETGDSLRETLMESIAHEYEPFLTEAIERVNLEHQVRVEAALDKALLAIRGKAKPTAPKKERKPRADKRTKRLKRGLPEAPAEAGPVCADVDCEHYEFMHDPEHGCGALNCNCKAFVPPTDDAAF